MFVGRDYTNDARPSYFNLLNLDSAKNVREHWVWAGTAGAISGGGGGGDTWDPTYVLTVLKLNPVIMLFTRDASA